MRQAMMQRLTAWIFAVVALFCASLSVASPLAELIHTAPEQRPAQIEQWAAQPTAARSEAALAWQEERVYQTPDESQFFLQQPDGQVVDIPSGKSLTALPAEAEPVLLNNRLRMALERYQAATQLQQGDTAARLAAVGLLQDAANPAWLPLLQAQLQREQEPTVRTALQLATARIQLHSDQLPQQLAAINTLADTRDPNLLVVLQELADSTPQAAVRQAALRAMAQLESAQFTDHLLGHLFSGISLGSVLLLAALGLAITYGLLGVINMAHGEMLMLGAYSTYVVQLAFQRYAPAWIDSYVLVALPVAFLVTCAIGMALERLVIRHLYGRPLETLLATWGMSLVLMQAVRVMFGAQNVEVANPSWMAGGWVISPALTLPFNRLVIIAFVGAVLLLTWWMLNRTRLGLFVRAVTQNRRMADCVGVPTGRVDSLAFGIGSGVAGLGGVALSQIGNVGPDLGQSYIVDSFMVVVLGGVGQLAGTVLGAFGLGMLNKILEPSLGAVLGKIAILALIILFIQKRPQGLFALKGRVLD